MLPSIPGEWRVHQPYGTHLPALFDAVLRTWGPVLEVGGGRFSTQVLRSFCDGMRMLTTVEFDPRWFAVLSSFACEWHLVYSVIPEEGEWDVALIDCEADRRQPAIEALRSRAKILVIHDTQDAGYHYDLSSFKYRREWHDLVPWTDVVSDFIDLDLVAKESREAF